MKKITIFNTFWRFVFCSTSFSASPSELPVKLDPKRWPQFWPRCNAMYCLWRSVLFLTENWELSYCPNCPKTVTFSFQGNVNIQGNYFIVDINQNWEFLWSWLWFCHFCKYTFTNFTDFFRLNDIMPIWIFPPFWRLIFP